MALQCGNVITICKLCWQCQYATVLHAGKRVIGIERLRSIFTVGAEVTTSITVVQRTSGRRLSRSRAPPLLSQHLNLKHVCHWCTSGFSGHIPTWCRRTYLALRQGSPCPPQKGPAAIESCFTKLPRWAVDSGLVLESIHGKPQLTTVIRALAAGMYDPEPPVWLTPQLLQLNIEDWCTCAN